MNGYQATAIVIALFVVRIILPILLVIVVGYAMNRLVGRWEKEDAAQASARPRLDGPVTAANVPKPTIPCWVFNNCSEKARAGCPAYKQPSVACWVARIRADGKLPAKCAGCERYTGVPAGINIRFSGD